MSRIFFNKRELRPSGWATFALIVLIFAGLAFVAAGPLMQLEALIHLLGNDAETSTRLRLIDASMALSILGTALSLIGLLHALLSTRVRLSWRGIAALVLIATLAWPVSRAYLDFRDGTPADDLSTDPANPPLFATLQVRAPREDAKAPHPAPLLITTTPASATLHALEIARRQGWTIISSDIAVGRIEATSHDRWFGTISHIAIRVRPSGTGSLLDIRAVSEMGVSDWGMNAALIRDFLNAMVA